MTTLKKKCIYLIKEDKSKINSFYFSIDVREAILGEREDLRNLIFELAEVYGGAVLHYNKKIDDIHSNRFGNFEK